MAAAPRASDEIDPALTFISASVPGCLTPHLSQSVFRLGNFG
jgi:hypothetical protein